MKRIIFFMTANLFLISTLTAQNDQKTLAFGINFNPNRLTKTPLIFIDNELESDGGISEIKESGIFGYSIGANLIRYWNDKIGIEAGIYYSQRGYIWKYTRVSYTDSVFMRVNHEINPITDEITHLYHCIDIPVSLRYKFFNSDKIDIYFRGGLIPYLVFKEENNEKFHFIIGGYEEFHHEDTKMKYFTTNANISALIALGETFSLTEKLNFQLEVLTNYNILGMRIDYSDRLLNYGISVGIVYEF
jgi:hypothetical protein